MTALLVALSVLAWSAHAQVKPADDLSPKVITEMPREPDSFDFKTAKGTVRVVIDKSGRVARAKIHALRRGRFYDGGRLEKAQEEVNDLAKANAGSVGASVFLGFAHGAFVGCNKQVKPIGMRIYEYSINDDGLTKTVLMSGGTFAGTDAVFVRHLNEAGEELYWLIATYDDSFLLKPDFKLKGG